MKMEYELPELLRILSTGVSSCFTEKNGKKVHDRIFKTSSAQYQSRQLLSPLPFLGVLIQYSDLVGLELFSKHALWTNRLEPLIKFFWPYFSTIESKFQWYFIRYGPTFNQATPRYCCLTSDSCPPAWGLAIWKK